MFFFFLIHPVPESQNVIYWSENHQKTKIYQYFLKNWSNNYIAGRGRRCNGALNGRNKRNKRAENTRAEIMFQKPKQKRRKKVNIEAEIHFHLIIWVRGRRTPWLSDAIRPLRKRGLGRRSIIRPKVVDISRWIVNKSGVINVVGCVQSQIWASGAKIRKIILIIPLILFRPVTGARFHPDDSNPPISSSLLGKRRFLLLWKKKNCHLSISEIAVRMENLANCPKESSRIPEWSCHLL